MNNRPIGVFDSGIGGLTVLKELIKELPNESFIYLGDTARVPYGTRDKSTITKFALELVDFLTKQKVKTLVVACNTMSSVALPVIKKHSKVPLVDMINPTVDFALNNSKISKIGVIGTRATISSEAFEKQIKKIKPNIVVQSCACPLFVPFVEEGIVSGKALEVIAENYLKDLRDTDLLILGCTHYPILKSVIQKILPNAVLVDSAHATAKALKELLLKENLLSRNSRPSYKLFVTDDTKKTEEIANLFFDNKLPVKLKKVRI